MLSPSHVSGLLVTVPPVTPITSPTFHPGLTLAGVIRGQAGDLALLVAGQRFPVADTTGLQSGQNVTVEVMQQTDAGIQLRVTPQPMPEEPVVVSASPWQAVLTTVFDALGEAGVRPATAQLIPPQMPAHADALRTLFSLFIARGSLGEGLTTIATLTALALASGAALPEDAREWVALLLPTAMNDPARTEAVLRQWFQRSRSRLESQVALAESGDVDDLLSLIKQDIRAIVARLRNHPAMLEYLESTGETKRFHDAADRILERLTGTQIQNLRSLEQPYLFFELPMPADSPIRHAQIHIFGESGRRNADAQDATIVLDLSTTRLGDLWVSLKTVSGTCSCWFRATRPELVQLLESHAHELVAALSRSGYQNPLVKAMLWDGDRFAAAANLMRRFTPFTATA